MKPNKELAGIIKAIKQVAKDTDTSPSLVSKSALLKDGTVTDWQLRKFGGLGGIVRAHFPQEDKELAEIAALSQAKRYVNTLEKQVADQDLIRRRTLDAVSGLKPIKPVAPYKAKKNAKAEREMNLLLSDMHYGLIVEKDQVGNVNAYNWEIASRRTAMVIRDTINYKIDKRGEVKQLNVFLSGDEIQGLLHNIGYQNHDLVTYQLNGMMHIIGHAISALSQNFRHVKVFMQAGNHNDYLHKRMGGNRVIEEKFDSFTGPIYFALSAMFRDFKNVEFEAARNPYLFHDSIGGRILVTHGDTIFSKSLGYPGSNLAVKTLSEALNRFNAGEIAKGKEPIKAALFGHTHCYSEFITHDGVRVITNPSLSGVDGYAHSLGINSNCVGQVIFETTKDYIVGDSRLIQVNSADIMKELDKIIPIYKRTLTWT